MGVRWKQTVPVEEVIRLYTQEHMTPQEIAETVGYKDVGTVIEKLRRARVYKDDKIDRGKIKALWKAGWKVEDIAEDIKMPIAVVNEVIGG